MRSSLINHLLFVALLLAVAHDWAYAYIDPGSGAYILQLLLAGLLGALYFLRQHIVRLKNLSISFLKKFSKDEEK